MFHFWFFRFSVHRQQRDLRVNSSCVALTVIIASVLLMCYSVKLMETSPLSPHPTSGNSSLLSPNAVISDYANIIRIAQPSKAFIKTYGNETQPPIKPLSSSSSSSSSSSLFRIIFCVQMLPILKHTASIF